jgi:hypothetical protein
MSDTLSYLDSARCVSKVEVATPEVVSQHELDLVIAYLGDLISHEEVGRIEKGLARGR